jgi:hypothetical protein
MKNATRNDALVSGLLLFGTLLAAPARAQSKFGPIRTYVQQQTKPIASIDPAFGEIPTWRPSGRPLATPG